MKDKIFLTDGVWNSYQLPMIEDTESSPVKIVLMNDPIDFISWRQCESQTSFTKPILYGSTP